MDSVNAKWLCMMYSLYARRGFAKYMHAIHILKVMYLEAYRTLESFRVRLTVALRTVRTGASGPPAFSAAVPRVVVLAFRARQQNLIQ